MRHVSLLQPAPAEAVDTERDSMANRFLRWSRTAPASARLQGARALANAYLSGDLDPVEHAGALLGLTTLLDDPSPLVRRSLAEALSRSAGAPHALVTALAFDQADVAAPILSFSPVLTEAELVDAVAVGDGAVQSAVARRACVPVALAAALAEVGSIEACVVLCGNIRAEMTAAILARLVERHGGEADLREAVLARPELDAAVRHDLVCATAGALAGFVTDCGWLSTDVASRLVRDATDQATMVIAAEATNRGGPGAVQHLVTHLLAAGRLTPALVLRAALCGNVLFFDAALSELSGIPLARVAGFTRGGRTGFRALYARAGLPPQLLPAFTAAIAQRRTVSGTGATLQRERIGEALKACAAAPGADGSKIGALLRRLDAEAARETARAFVSVVRDGGRPAMPLLPRLSADDRLAFRPAA